MQNYQLRITNYPSHADCRVPTTKTGVWLRYRIGPSKLMAELSVLGMRDAGEGRPDNQRRAGGPRTFWIVARHSARYFYTS